MTVVIALLEPVSVATRTVRPSTISSRIRENMTTLASTAIPMEMMIPAMPGSVRTVPIDAMMFRISTTYSSSAMSAQKPNPLYMNTMRRRMIARPISPPIMLISKALYPIVAD